MRHSQLLEFFHERTNFSDDAISLGDNLVLRNFDFHSPDRSRSGREKPACGDAEIGENGRFRYHVLMPELMNQAQTIVILLHGLGGVFRSMLLYGVDREYRGNTLRALGSKRHAIALADDGVIMPHELLHTLGGKKKNDIHVDVMQYPYTYPFPAGGTATGKVDAPFTRTFGRICQFLGSRGTP